MIFFKYSRVQCLGSSEESPQSLTLSQNLFIGTHLLLLQGYSEIRHFTSEGDEAGSARTDITIAIPMVIHISISMAEKIIKISLNIIVTSVVMLKS